MASGRPSPRLVIRSPQTGYVVEKKIVVGAAVEAKMTLFEVADLSTVWVEADVYEKDIAFLQSGQKVEATVEACPNRIFTGKLALIYPQLDTATRTNRVRFELDNPQHELRPGMFATVRINTPLESIEPFKSMAAKSGRAVLTGLSRANAAAAIRVPRACRSGPSSIPARRRWCTSSGNRGCLKEWKSSLGLRSRRILSGRQGTQARATRLPPRAAS